MPTLSLFAATDHVLIDPISDKLSLIGIDHRVTAMPVQHGDNESPDFEASKFGLPPLSIAAFWIPAPEEIGKTFEQIIQIVAPDGKRTDVTAPFAFTVTKSFHRTIQPITVFVRNSGLFQLVIYLRSPGEEFWGDVKGQFCFEVVEPVSHDAVANLSGVDPKQIVGPPLTKLLGSEPPQS